MLRPLNDTQNNSEAESELQVLIPKENGSNNSGLCVLFRRKDEIIPASKLNRQAAKQCAKGCLCCVAGAGCFTGAVFLSGFAMGALETLCIISTLCGSVECCGANDLRKASKQAKLFDRSAGPEAQTMEPIPIYDLLNRSTLQR